MWLRCCQCDRTTLCFDVVAAMPYRCRSCRELKPDWKPRRVQVAIGDDRVVAAGGFVDTSRDVVIDVTPMEN